MTTLENKIIQKAEQCNFQLLTNTPEKLESYIVEKILSPIAESILKINEDFYNIKTGDFETVIKIIDENFYIQKEEKSLKILKDYNDGLLLLLTIVFENEQSYVEQGNDLVPLIESYLYFALEKSYK